MYSSSSSSSSSSSVSADLMVGYNHKGLLAKACWKPYREVMLASCLGCVFHVLIALGKIGILHGYCSGVWLKEPDVMSSSDGASWNEERFWWYINTIVYDLK
jgi:hypothetical protein